jgi:hypothetical protein
MLSLKAMTESKLKVLKRAVEAAIHTKITARRQEIELELSRLSLLDGSARVKAVRAAARGMDAAKYQNSASPRQGAGRKPNVSLIVDSPKASTSAKQPKKARKTNKVRNAGEIAQAVVLTSVEFGHIEQLRIEPPDGPVPLEPLSQAILGDLGGTPVAAVVP